MVQVNTKEMISAAYGMGNVPSGTSMGDLCQDFYTRDIRAEDKPLHLISSSGQQNTANPDSFWISNTWRRPLTDAELEQYYCLFASSSDLFSTATNSALNAMPSSPDSIRIPALLVGSLQSINSPIIRYLISVAFTTAFPILGIAALVKGWRLIRSSR
jgi:hypothetical protein